MATSSREAGVEAVNFLKSTDPPVWLAPDSSLSHAARTASQHIFSSLRPYAPKSPFDHLLVDGFDAEQIWQQIDIQSQPILSTIRRDLKRFEKNPEEISNLKLALEVEKKSLEDKYESLDDDNDDFDENMEELDEEDEEEEEDKEEDGQDEGEEDDENSNEKHIDREGGDKIEDGFLKIKELEEFLEEDEAREYGLESNNSKEKEKQKQKKKEKGTKLNKNKEVGENDAETDDEDEDDDEFGEFGIGDNEDEDFDELGNARLFKSPYITMAERLIIRRKGGPPERRATSASSQAGPSTSSQAGSSNRPVRPPQSNRPQFYTNEYRSLACEEQFNLDLLHRSVTLSKYVDFAGWESLGIQEMFDRIGLHGVYKLRGDSCDRIVRLFYANMGFSGRTGTIKTYILGTEILITPETVNQLIGFPGEGAERYYQSVRNCPFMGTAEGTEFLRLINRNSDIVGSPKPRAKDMNAKARVVHNMVCHTLLPRHGHRDLVNFMDLYVMEKLYSGRMFDPGFMILCHMCEIGRTRNKNLPYGVLIMQIVKHFQIQLPPDVQMRKQRASEVFGKIHLVKMGLVETDGIWTSKVDEGPLQDDTHVEQPTDTTLPETSRADVVSIAERLDRVESKLTEMMNYQRDMFAYQRETRQIILDWIGGHDGGGEPMGADDDGEAMENDADDAQAIDAQAIDAEPIDAEPIDAQPMEGNDEGVQSMSGDDADWR